MGGSLCARRSITVGSKQSDLVILEKIRKNGTKDVQKIESKAATARLPTQSWIALLKGSPLNPDAKPFTPSGLEVTQCYEFTKQSPKLPPGLDPPVSAPGLHGPQRYEFTKQFQKLPPGLKPPVSAPGLQGHQRYEFTKQLPKLPPGLRPQVSESPGLQGYQRSTKQLPRAPPGLEPPVSAPPGLPGQQHGEGSKQSQKLPLGLEPPVSELLGAQGFQRCDFTKQLPKPPPRFKPPVSDSPGPQGRKAYEFTKQSPKLPPGLEPPVCEPTAGTDEPEWMQYLSKKLWNQLPAQSAPARPPGVHIGRDLNWNLYGCANQPIANCLRSKHANPFTTTPDNNVAISGGGIPVSSLVIYTEEYLSILKEIKPAGCSAQFTHDEALGGKDKLGKGKPGADKSRRPADEADPAGRGFHLNVSMSPKNASSFAEKRDSDPKVDAEFNNAPEEDVLRPTTQDDLEMEKKLLDQDLTEPAYWSETECVARKGLSAHLFGRRPRTSKSMIRSYVMQDLSFDLDRAVGMLLLRLQRFIEQKRSFKQEGSRRFLMGLSVVARRAKRTKLDCLIIAPDIEEDAELDKRMHELLASASQNNIPVIFALSRSCLGQALGKSQKISVLGVLDTTGARELMAQCIRIAHDCRQAWLSRHRPM